MFVCDHHIPAVTLKNVNVTYVGMVEDELIVDVCGCYVPIHQ